MKSGVAPILDPDNINSGYPLYLRRFTSGQYLCHIAYFLASQKPAPSSIKVLDEDGIFRKHLVKQIPLKEGLYGYILLPEDKTRQDVKILWRGTDPTDPHSVQINLEEGGPAVKSFYESKDTIFRYFYDAITEYYPDKPQLTLTVSGHSQGGALSQLFATHLLLERYHSPDYDHIKTMNMTVLSSAGVPTAIAALANEYASKLKACANPIEIIANFGLVKGDLVPTLGLDTIFATLPKNIVLVNVLKVLDENYDLWQKDVYWHDGLQISEIFSIIKNTIKGYLGAHSATNYFAPVDENGKIAVSKEYQFWTNENPEHRASIEAELLNKAYKLQTSLYFIQQLMYDIDVLGITNLLSVRNLHTFYSGVLYYFNSPKESPAALSMNENQILQCKNEIPKTK